MQATQTVSHVVSQSKSATLSIPKQIPQHITQTEFVLLLSLRGRFSQLEEHVGAKEAELKARLEGGRSVAWREIAERLGDRLYGEGEGFPYCQRVLNSTKPTRMVSLEIR